MNNPGLIDDFRKWASVNSPYRDRLLVVDPGKTTGVCRVYGSATLLEYRVDSLPLAELPVFLHRQLRLHYAVICEDYSVHGKNVDPKAYAAVGKGMAWSASCLDEVPMFLFQPNMKAAGRMRLDQRGLDARAAAKNDHERDVIDLAGKALYELRKANPNAR